MSWKKQWARLKYISSTFIHSTTIAGAGQHPFDTCQWIVLRLSLRYTRCRPTHLILVQCWTSVAALCCFNAEKFCLRRWPNTTPTLGLLYTQRQHPSKHVSFTQYCLNVCLTCSTLARHWNSIGWLSCVCLAAMRVTLCSSRRQKSHYPGNMIHWPNADVMLGHRLWRWAKIIPNLSH